MKTLEAFSLRLPEPLLKKVKTNSEKNGQQCSDYLRHLIELGLRIEEIQNKAEEPQKKLEALVYKSVLENVMLTRAIVRSSPHLQKEQQETYLKKSRETAIRTVREFWGDDCLADDE